LVKQKLAFIGIQQRSADIQKAKRVSNYLGLVLLFVFYRKLMKIISYLFYKKSSSFLSLLFDAWLAFATDIAFKFDISCLMI